jgi:hypothetical protein
MFGSIFDERREGEGREGKIEQILFPKLEGFGGEGKEAHVNAI